MEVGSVPSPFRSDTRGGVVSPPTTGRVRSPSRTTRLVHLPPGFSTRGRAPPPTSLWGRGPFLSGRTLIFLPLPPLTGGELPVVWFLDETPGPTTPGRGFSSAKTPLTSALWISLSMFHRPYRDGGCIVLPGPLTPFLRVPLPKTPGPPALRPDHLWSSRVREGRVASHLNDGGVGPGRRVSRGVR